MPSVRGNIFADIAVSQGESPIGTIRIRLEHEKAPRVVAAFVGLATGARDWIDPVTNEIQSGVPYYDGIIFHRLIHDFVIQGGDPTGTGTAGPGYVFQDQFHPDLRHSGRYMVSTAKNTNPNTFGSQFFITLESASHLDDKHSVFGEVISDATYPESRALIDRFTSATEFAVTNSVPDRPLTMTSVTISGSSFADFDLNDPEHRLPYLVDAPVVPFPIRSGVDDVFQLRFRREALYDYLILSGSNLAVPQDQWSMLSANTEDDYVLTVPWAPGPKHFYRHILVDYSQLYHPLSTILQEGAILQFSDPDGGTVTLTSDGVGTGTWVDSSGASGVLSEFTFLDVLPVEGAFLSQGSQAEFIPLMNFDCSFDSPAGATGMTSLSGLLSFHSDVNGGFEGSQNSTSTYNRPFLFTHATSGP